MSSIEIVTKHDSDGDDDNDDQNDNDDHDDHHCHGDHDVTAIKIIISEI